ncbi:MAG: penicillin-binding protein 1C [candidate division KSB1 bacterium]|nr:penicillin-binding protein 1C [candidate division KSB1 bacterium]
MARTAKRLAALVGMLSTGVLALLLVPLPRELANRTSGEVLRLTDRHGRLLQERVLGEGRGQWVELNEVSPYAIEATVAVEDHRFYRHWGIDPVALVRAAVQAARAGRIVSGASTLTQQLARLLYHLPRRWWAKPLEMILAVRLELALRKEEILTQYLNRVPYGNNAVGIEAAARLYFGKPAHHLTLAEAALLSGLPQAPARYDPYRYPERARRRQAQVLGAMLRHGMIDSVTYAQACNAELSLSPPERSFFAPHFCDWLVSNCRGFGLPDKGVVQTTLDLTVQQQVELLLRSHVQLLASRNVTNAGALVLDNKDGSVLAMVGSADYFDEARHGQVNACLALRQPGSTIKPFTYGLALEQGWTAAHILADIETHAAGPGGDFRVHNYDRLFHGPVRLRVALACSYNVPAVRLLEELGPELLLAKLRQAGFESLSKPASHYGLGLTLGNGEVTLLELTLAYSALANGGAFHREKVLQADRAETETRQLFSPQVAYLLTNILADREARMPAFGEGNALELPFPCAAKTGTSKDYRDNWAVGYTTRYTVGVWVGNFGGEAMQKVSGISGAGLLFRDIMLLLHRQAWPEPFAVPFGVVEREICARSGELPGPYCPGTVREFFVAGTEPTRTCSVHRPFPEPTRDGTKCAVVVYEVWPPQYEQWLVSAGVPRPPSLPPAQQQGAQSNPELPVITFPDEGDIYRLDPVLRAEFQTLELQAVVPPGVTRLSWWVDDSLVCTVGYPFCARWPLAPGAHRVQAKAEAGGLVLVSKPVHITVL